MKNNPCTLQIINKTFWKLEIVGSDDRYTINKYATAQVPLLIGKVQVKLASPFGWFWKATLKEASKGGSQNLIYKFQYGFRDYKKMIIRYFLVVLMILFMIFNPVMSPNKYILIIGWLQLGFISVMKPKYELIKSGNH